MPASWELVLPPGFSIICGTTHIVERVVDMCLSRAILFGALPVEVEVGPSYHCMNDDGLGERRTDIHRYLRL